MSKIFDFQMKRNLEESKIPFTNFHDAILTKTPHGSLKSLKWYLD